MNQISLPSFKGPSKPLRAFIMTYKSLIRPLRPFKALEALKGLIRPLSDFKNAPSAKVRAQLILVVLSSVQTPLGIA